MNKIVALALVFLASGITSTHAADNTAQSRVSNSDCSVAANTLANARRLYDRTCSGSRVDCDTSRGIWYCANFRNPNTEIIPTQVSTPAPTPAPNPVPPVLAPAKPPVSSRDCSVAANTVAAARRLYERTCSTPRVDCDQSGGLWYCANYKNPTSVIGPNQRPTPTPVIVPPPPTSSQALIDINYENGQSDSGYNEIGWTNSGIEPNNRRRVTIQSDGNYAIAHTEVKGDRFEAGAPRTESDTIGIPETNYKDGDSMYYGFSIYFPESWEFDGVQDDIVFQFKQFSSRPSAFVVQKYDKLFYRIGNSSDNFRYEITKQPLQKGVWHDIRIHIVWSRFDNGKGKIQLDHKVRGGTYQRAFTHRGKNMHPAPAGNGYIKFGMYKPNMRNSFVNSRTVLHDNIRVGRTLESVSVY